MDRRTFLRGAAATAGAVAVGGRVPAWAGEGRRLAGGSLIDGPAASSPVENIVVICMENRSFDHYLGWLATDEQYLEAGRRRYGRRFAVDGVTDLDYQRPDGSIASTFHLPDWEDTTNAYRGCGGHPDPGHGRGTGLRQRDGGFVADGTGNDDFAIGWFGADEVPCYSQLARNGTVFDRYHCSLLASTYPNRQYLHSAQSGGMLTNELPIEELGYQWPTIWDRLGAAGVPATTYGVDLPTTALWGPRLLPHTRPIAGFFADAAVGMLPNVTFVDPGFLSGMRTDDHPHGDMRLGQRFVASIIDVLQRSPQWGSMAVFVTYDEWGGFFDHVAPPLLPDDFATADETTSCSLAGFRLPVTLHSPFARPGYVDHRLYDHTSILRFIEWRFLGAPPEGPTGSGWWLTQRDRYANNIGAALAAERINDFELDASIVPFTVSTPCDGQVMQDVPGLDDLEDEIAPLLTGLGVDLAAVEAEASIVVPSDFELLAGSGYFEAAGYDITASLTLHQLLQG
jgi:phospholipase C